MGGDFIFFTTSINMIRRSRNVPSTEGMVVVESAGNGKGNSKAGVCVAIVLAVVLAVLLGVTIALLVRNKKNGKGCGKVVHKKVDAYIKLAKMSLGSMSNGLSDHQLDGVGHQIEQKNLRSGRSPFHVSSLSPDEAKRMVHSVGHSVTHPAAQGRPAHHDAAHAMKSHANGNANVHANGHRGVGAPSPHHGQETQAIGHAFAGGMANPPCRGTGSLDSPHLGRGPLTAGQQAPFDSSLARAAQHHDMNSRVADASLDLSGLGMMGKMNAAANAATGPLYAGKTSGEMYTDKMTAALKAAGAHANTSAAPLAPANEIEKVPGMLADGSTAYKPHSFVTPGLSRGVKGTPIAAAMADNSDELYKAFDSEDGAKLKQAFNLSAQLPSTSLAGADYQNKNRENTLAAHQLAKENPEQAGLILMNSTALHQPTASQLRQQHLNMATVQRPVDSRFAFRNVNLKPTDLLRTPMAMPTPTGYSEAVMSVPFTYADQWRSSTCAGGM